jgi:hypothetical protein
MGERGVFDVQRRGARDCKNERRPREGAHSNQLCLNKHKKGVGTDRPGLGRDGTDNAHLDAATCALSPTGFFMRRRRVVNYLAVEIAALSRGSTISHSGGFKYSEVMTWTAGRPARATRDGRCAPVEYIPEETGK